MKKVLIIAYLFPPSNAVGALRPYGLAKYLPTFGWEAIVLTVKHPGESPDGIKVIESEYTDTVRMLKSKFRLDSEKGLHEQVGVSLSEDDDHSFYLKCKKSIIKLVIEAINYPDAVKRGWYKHALRSASEYMLKERPDAIISTSGPVTSHLVARKLKQRYKIPWIADLRDLWTQNHFSSRYGLTRFFMRRLEKKTFSAADALVTVTEPWSRTLKLVHKKKKTFCVTNGFDEDDFLKLTSGLTKKFTITYTGALYNGKREPSLLFEVVKNLIAEGKIHSDLIELRFFGHIEDWLTSVIKKNNLDGIANCYGLKPREDVLKRQKESQLLLLLLASNNKEMDVYPAKIFEYFGVGRPIIAMGGQAGIVKELLDKTKAGKFAENYNELVKIILDYYEEFTRTGEVRYLGNSNVKNYTYGLKAKKYSEILDGLVLK